MTVYLTLSNNFFGSCGTRFTSITMVRAARLATSRSGQIASRRKIRSEGRACSPATSLRIVARRYYRGRLGRWCRNERACSRFSGDEGT